MKTKPMGLNCSAISSAVGEFTWDETGRDLFVRVTRIAYGKVGMLNDENLLCHKSCTILDALLSASGVRITRSNVSLSVCLSFCALITQEPQILSEDGTRMYIETGIEIKNKTRIRIEIGTKIGITVRIMIDRYAKTHSMSTRAQPRTKVSPIYVLAISWIRNVCQAR
ncbi:hypothetical protein EVAR_49593_1 [Eumeta japonica]|uniref:Uncharacterized protein n=1 Tax=Eumeta variegata TaxID=151549 RepID=A0A4C1ZUJ1_EUMVA|nr:hypothetical protein EVAR_49593_1 [Eumeta japonica]